MDRFDYYIKEITDINPYDFDYAFNFEEHQKLLRFKILRDKELNEEEKDFLTKRISAINILNYKNPEKGIIIDVFKKFVEQNNNERIMNTDDFIFYKFEISKLLELRSICQDYVEKFDDKGILTVLIDLAKITASNGNKASIKLFNDKLNEALHAGVIGNKEYLTLADFVKQRL